DERGLEVAETAHPAQDTLPAFERLPPAERVADPLLPLGAARDLRPRLDTHRAGPDGLPDVDVGMPGDQHVLVADRLDEPRLLAAGDEVVDQHAEAAAGAGAELGDP